MKLTFDATPEELKIFAEEADEQIAILDNGVLELEREPSPDLLSSIFRAAHTLKGSSATLGHTRMAELTHTLESVLDRLRKDDLPISTALIDGLLHGLDALRVLREEIDTGETGDLDLASLVAEIRCLETSQTAPAPASPMDAPVPLPSLPADGAAALQVDVQIAADCAFAAVRAFQVLNELQQLGTVLWSKPSEADIAAEQVGRDIRVLIATNEEPDRLAGAAKAIVDIVSVSVVPSTAEAPTAEASQTDGNSAQVPYVQSDEYTGPDRRNPNALSNYSGPERRKQAKTIRFDVSRLDTLMDLMGEMVVERSRLTQIAASIGERFGDVPQLRELHESTQRLGRVVDELQRQTMHARMLPVDQVFSRFPRMVRDLAQRSGKEIDFIVDGQETELDRSIIEEIGDPIIHLLRNAVDHAIEPPEDRKKAGKNPAGRIRLSAFHSENQIVIQVQDDGRGIDVDRLRAKAVERGTLTQEAADRLSHREAVNLIFDAGLSTAAKVTDVSGRGVGMDIVRTNIEKLNGSISIDTQPCAGTTFTVRVPLTLAIMPVLLVKVAGDTCAVPLASVVETLRVSRTAVQTIHGNETVRLRDHIVPLLRLRSAFGLPPAEHDGLLFIVAVRSNDRIVGLVVDSLLRDENIVIKSLGPIVGAVPGVSGATILGDGTVGLIVDVPSLVARAIQIKSQAA